MSPGATFARVYHELKRMLATGELPPGTPIEPAVIGKQIASSITPVRDALHRLTGERLVEAPNHNGFRVPLLSEAGLRDLYGWNAQLLGLAVRVRPADAALSTDATARLDAEDVGAHVARLFLGAADLGGSSELSYAVRQLNDRLAAYRRAEALVLDGLMEEYHSLSRNLARGARREIVAGLARYHRRRMQAVAQIVARAQGGRR